MKKIIQFEKGTFEELIVEVNIENEEVLQKLKTEIRKIKTEQIEKYEDYYLDDVVCGACDNIFGDDYEIIIPDIEISI